MAGRVERRINDKFYFVVDEVGGSSDCESELASDTNTKAGVSLNEKCNTLNDVGGKSSSKDDFASDEMIDLNPELKESPVHQDSNSSQGSNYLRKSEESRDKSKAYSSNNHSDEAPNTNDAVSSSQEISAVDMELDSDSECEEPRVEPLIRITFRDETVEELLKASLYKFLSQKIENCTMITSSENCLQMEIYDKDPSKLLREDLLDFDLDTTPGYSHSNVPFYGKSHDFVLNDKSEEKSPKGKLCAPVVNCFNCLGNHNLRDCRETKNFQTINMNRLKYQKSSKQSKTSRYHLDENQKFSHIVPGVISKKLRNALNLHRDQQPGFIYRMRSLGYPPAWLEEAKVSHSGVAMYNSKGVPVLEEDEEEGEIIPEGSKDRYDISKIIEFPGFNVPLPSNFKEESKLYHCPAISEAQSKENLIKQLEPKTVQAYVKKSLTTQKSEEKCSSQDDVKMISSPTIEEMEEKKRQLLMELNNEDSASDTKLNSEDSSAGARVEPDVAQNVQSREIGSVKNLEFGTPILKSVSPFSKLPSREQFSVNVSDIINFENLPNSTGKYETMRSVISKIRITTSKSQSD